MKKKILTIGVLVVMLLGLMVTPVIADDVDLAGGVYDSVLTLDNKTSAWALTPDDDIGGTLGYLAEDEEFVWGLEAEGLDDGEYTLIYYADYSGDRFGDWGGDNPGAVIAVVVASGGSISASGSSELGMDLPCPPDANQFEHNYSGAPDNYVHAHGAKIWLVPTSALTGGELPVQAWPPNDNWLFETDLIWYNDTGVESTIASITVEPTSINFGILMPGQTGNGGIVTVTNSGSCPVTVEASVSTGNVFEYLLLDGSLPSAYSVGLFMGGYDEVAVTLPVPGDYTPQGVEIGTLTFEIWVE